MSSGRTLRPAPPGAGSGVPPKARSRHALRSSPPRALGGRPASSPRRARTRRRERRACGLPPRACRPRPRAAPPPARRTPRALSSTLATQGVELRPLRVPERFEHVVGDLLDRPPGVQGGEQSPSLVVLPEGRVIAPVGPELVPDRLLRVVLAPLERAGVEVLLGPRGWIVLEVVDEAGRPAVDPDAELRGRQAGDPSRVIALEGPTDEELVEPLLGVKRPSLSHAGREVV